jgi:dienelactone hydrolase
VLVGHDWSGRNARAERVASELAQKGYVALAIDMYGEGQTGETVEEKMALMGPLNRERGRLMARVQAAAACLRGLERVDGTRMAALGFCFGGLCALDLARSGEDIAGVVSFHGLLNPPPAELLKPIKAKLLVLHGHRDPMVPPEQVAGFEKEMAEAGADWQLTSYGNAVHAFTNPDANNPDMGTVYDATVANRAWKSCHDFLEEIFA